MELLRRKTLNYIKEHSLFHQGDTLVVAVSGGADSTALLDILANLPGLDLRLAVAHLNHLLRGAESAADEFFAGATAERYGLPFELARVDVAAMALERGLSLEEAGREARYAFFREVAGKYRATAIALGHHKGDQAETVLMRLLRGAGGSGLSGMRPKSAAGMIVRPLLSVYRSDIEAYLRKGGLTWRDDSSNTDVRFLRNRIRHELIPYLESCNPDIVERLHQTAEVLAADEDILESVADGIFSRSTTVTASGAEVRLEALCKEPRSLRKRLYRKAILTIKGDLQRISFAHLAAIDKLVYADRPNSELTLPDGIRAIRAYGLLRFTRESEDLPPTDHVLLDCPGLYDLPCGGTILIEESEEPATSGNAAGANLLFVPSGQFQFPLNVRYFRKGDRFIPLGMNSRKKLKDLFIDRKIPLKSRTRIPLLVDRDEIVWVCGVQKSEKIRAVAVDNRSSWLLITYTSVNDRH